MHRVLDTNSHLFCAVLRVENALSSRKRRNIFVSVFGCSGVPLRLSALFFGPFARLFAFVAFQSLNDIKRPHAFRVPHKVRLVSVSSSPFRHSAVCSLRFEVSSIFWAAFVFQIEQR